MMTTRRTSDMKTMTDEEFDKDFEKTNGPAREYYQQSESDRPDKATVDRVVKDVEYQFGPDSVLDTLNEVYGTGGKSSKSSIGGNGFPRNVDYGGNPDALPKKPVVNVRANNQSAITQVSPNVTDSAIGGVTTGNSSAPSSLSPDGNESISFFGSKARKVNQTTGAETWYDVDRFGNLTERKDAPNSEKVAQNGGVWSKVAGDKEAELWHNRLMFERQSQEKQKRMKAMPNKIIGEQLAVAGNEVLNGRGTIKESKSGNFYRVYKVSGDSIQNANDALMKIGGKAGRHRIDAVFASIQTDKNGNPLEGAQVRFDIRRVRNGNVSSSKPGAGDVRLDTMSLGAAQDYFANALINSGEVDGDDAKNVARNRVISMFGSGNPNDWAVNRNNLANQAAEAKIANDKTEAEAKKINADANMKEAEARASINPGDAYAGKNRAAIIDSIFKNDTDGSFKKMSKDDPAKFSAYVDSLMGKSGEGEIKAAPENSGSPADVLGKRLKAAELKKRGVGGIVASDGNGARSDQQHVEPVKVNDSELSKEEAWGKRKDGSAKGRGWLGTFKMPDGSVASEYSIGVNIGGKEVEIPSLVPGLTGEQVDRMVTDIIPNGKQVPKDIVNVAVKFAKERMSQGKSPFASSDEDFYSFDKENDRLVAEFKKYGGTVNDDGSFKLGHTDILPAGDTTDLSDRTGISQELVDLQKKLFDDKSLQKESEKAEEDKVRKELARKYAGNKKGLDKEVEEHMRRWRDKQFWKSRAGARIEKMPAFAL